MCNINKEKDAMNLGGSWGRHKENEKNEWEKNNIFIF